MTRSKEVAKPNTSISELIRESPAMTIKKYQHNQFHTFDVDRHEKTEEPSRREQNKANDRINRKYK